MIDRLRRRCAYVLTGARRRLLRREAGLELRPEAGDVAQTAAAGGLVETEALGDDSEVGEEAELVGSVVRLHGSSMKEGCHSRRGRSDRTLSGPQGLVTTTEMATAAAATAIGAT